MFQITFRPEDIPTTMIEKSALFFNQFIIPPESDQVKKEILAHMMTQMSRLLQKALKKQADSIVTGLDRR